MHIQSSGFTAACTLEAVLLLAAGHCYLSEHWPAYTPFQVQKRLLFQDKHQYDCRKNSSRRDNARNKCLLRLQRKIHRNNLKVTTLSFTPNAKPRRY